MALHIDIPLNTGLADLDETLRDLLRTELKRHGFDSVEIAFDAPSREWSSQITGPTVNLFLYDLRESDTHRWADWKTHRVAGGARDVRPPLMLECSYAVTAWTSDVEDEHRLLSQVLAVLYEYPILPMDVVKNRVITPQTVTKVETRIAQSRAEGRADFWTAVGGQYKASLDFIVLLPCESGTTFTRGPEVRTQTLVAQIKDGPPSTISEFHRFGGKVSDPDGNPLPDVWVTLPDLGLVSVTDPEGHFLFSQIPPGKHKCRARSSTGAETELAVTIPGKQTDLTLTETKGKAKARS